MSSSSDPFRHRSNKPSREVGDAPSIGHVPRMHKGSESRAGRRTRRPRSSSAPKSAPGPAFGITIAVCLLAVLVLAGGLVLWVKRSQNKQVARESFLPASPVTSGPVSIPLAAAPDEAALLDLVKSFLATRVEAELEDQIRPSSQSPAAIIQRLVEIEKIDGKVSSMNYLGSMDSRALQIEGVVVNFADNRNRLALLAPDANGKWRVDFDAFDRYVSPDWATLLSGGAVSGTIRIFCSEDSYYNGNYRDDSKWACYGMASPDSETLMFGYVDKKSPQFEVMTKVLSQDASLTLGAPNKSKRLTLEVRHDPEANPRQFEITRVLSDEWAVGEQPLDEKLGRPLSAGLK